jgi:hypothetical protein
MGATNYLSTPIAACAESAGLCAISESGTAKTASAELTIHAMANVSVAAERAITERDCRYLHPAYVCTDCDPNSYHPA